MLGAVPSPDLILQAARRVVDRRVRRGALFTSPKVVKDYLMTKLSGYEHEVFAVLLLDAKHDLIEYVEMFNGSICQTSVYPREVLKLALKHNAAALLIAHCHPSGNPEPSVADQSLTRQLTEALKLVDVRVLDHVIVAGNATVSFAERGLM